MGPLRQALSREEYDDKQFEEPFLSAEERLSEESHMSPKTVLPLHALTRPTYPYSTGVHRSLRRQCGGAVCIFLAILAILTCAGMYRGLAQWPFHDPNAELMSARPTRYVPVWTSDSLPGGFAKEEVQIPSAAKTARNVTSVFAAMRAAVIDTHFDREDQVLLRIIGSIYDDPQKDEWHVSLSEFFSGGGSHELRASVPTDPANPDTDSAGPNVVIGSPSFSDGRDFQWSFPADLFLRHGTPQPLDGTSSGSVVIPVKLEIIYGERVLNTFTFQLRQKWLPYAKMAICMKPIYGEKLPDSLVEWREHHRMLGWPLVHWVSRTTGMSKAITKLNELTGGYDTFEHTPIFQDDKPAFWDEYQTFNECYVRYKQASEFIAVFDGDEYLAPHTDFPWTKEFVDQYLTKSWATTDPEASALQMPMTWVDKRRFGEIGGESLLAVDPSLSETDVHDMQGLHLAAGGIVEKHQERYFKAVYRTSKIRLAGIHDGWPGEPTFQDPFSLIIYHARGEQGMALDTYHPWPLSETITAHWAGLVQRIRRLNLNSLYELDLSS